MDLNTAKRVIATGPPWNLAGEGVDAPCELTTGQRGLVVCQAHRCEASDVPDVASFECDYGLQLAFVIRFTEGFPRIVDINDLRAELQDAIAGLVGVWRWLYDGTSREVDVISQAAPDGRVRRIVADRDDRTLVYLDFEVEG